MSHLDMDELSLVSSPLQFRLDDVPYDAALLRIVATFAHPELGERRAEADAYSAYGSDILFLKHGCSILRQSSDPVCGFSMREQVRLCAVWPTENWFDSSMNHIWGLMTV